MTKLAELDDLTRLDVESRYRWVADDELGPVYGIPRDAMREMLMAYDADPKSGFPRKHRMLKRRWLPAVDDYFNEVNRPRITLSGSKGHD